MNPIPANKNRNTRIVRSANLMDIIEMTKVAKQFLTESPEYEGFNENKFAHSLNTFIINPNKMCLVALAGTKIIGGIAAELEEYYYRDGYMATEKFFYILPKFRGTRVASYMINGYIEWAKSKQAHKIYISTTSGINPDATLKLYLKHDFYKVGYICVR